MTNGLHDTLKLSLTKWDATQRTASKTIFGKGDGSKVLFFLTGDDGLPVGAVIGTPVLFNQHWAGIVKLFNTPRTNLFLNTSVFELGSYDKLASTFTAGQATAPDGASQAGALNENTAIAEHVLQMYPQAGSMVAGDTYTATIFAKANTRSKVRFSNPTGGGVRFDLATGTIISPGNTLSTTITPAALGWYRLRITFVALGTADTLAFFLKDDVTTGESYLGDGKGVYVWGNQIEKTSEPGVFIPTTTSVVTRTDYTLSSDSRSATFAPAPPVGSILLWDGAYTYQNRFWDIVLDSRGDLALQVGSEAVAQDVASVLSTYQGEAFFNTLEGIPYRDTILGKFPNQTYLTTLYNNAAETVPDVVDAQTTFDPLRSDRILKGTVKVIDTFGQSINASF